MRLLREILRLALACMLMLCFVLPCYAEEVVEMVDEVVEAAAENSDFSFALDSTGNGYVVTGYTGTDAEITVPAWYMGKPVTEVGEGAFQGNTTITTVTLPNTITVIGVAGFKGCTSLTTINTYSDELGRVPGDADDSAVVDIDDILRVLEYGVDNTVEINLLNADVNADGSVDAQDVLILMQYEAAWESAELQ